MAGKRPLVLDAAGGKQQIQTGDFLDVAYGGTGATTAGAARTNLALVPGTDIQAYSAQLAAVAALATTGAVVRTGANTFAMRALTQPAAGITVSNGDGVAGNPTLALANDLGALEGLSGTGFAVRTGADAWAQRSVATAAVARITVSNGDGVAGNPTVDLATVANGGTGTFLKLAIDTYGRVTGTTAVVAGDLTTLLNTTYLGLGGGTLTNFLTLHADPTSAMHAVTKQYADAIAEGRRDKPGVRFLVSTNINTANPGTATFDGGTAVNGNRLLLVGQTAQAENGPWVFNGSGAALTRPTDFNASTEVVSGATYFVDEGTNFSDSNWTLISSGPYTLGSTALTFTQTNSLGQITDGAGLTKTGNTLAVNLSARLSFTGDTIDLASGIITPGTSTKITYDTYGRVTGAAAATAADVGAQASSAELTALAGLAATGLVARTNTSTFAPRSLSQPAAGMTITNADGVAGNPTFAFANDLAALEGLASTGIAVRTGADAWSQRSVAVASTTRLTVTNADGAAGNPTLDLASGVATPGTYSEVTVDTYGRVTSGTNNGGGANPTQTTLTNNEVSTVNICNAVYIDGAGTFKKANGNAAGTSLPIGLTAAGITAAGSGAVQTSAELTATTGQWDAVTGQTGGLTPNATYFLDVVTAGKITSTAPATGFLIKVGQAMSATKLLIRIGERIEL